MQLGKEFAEALFSHYLTGLRNHFPTIVPKVSYEADINKLVPQTIHFLRAASAILRAPSLEIAAMNARGEAYVTLGELGWAEDWFKRALERDGRYLPAHNNLAVLYWGQGDVGKTTEHLGMALEISSDDRTTVLNGGAVLAALGRVADACGLYANFLAQHPDDGLIAERLRELSDVSAAGGAATSSLSRT